MGGKQQPYSHSQESKGNWCSYECRIIMFVEIRLAVWLSRSPEWQGLSSRKWYCKWSGRRKNYNSDWQTPRQETASASTSAGQPAARTCWLQLCSWGQLSPAATERRSGGNRAQPWQTFLPAAGNWKSYEDHYLHSAYIKTCAVLCAILSVSFSAFAVPSSLCRVCMQLRAEIRALFWLPQEPEKKTAQGLLASPYFTAFPRAGHLAASFLMDISLQILPFAFVVAL